MSAIEATIAVDWKAELRAWRKDVAALFRDMREWSEAEGWRVTEETTTISEEEVFGQYKMPKLRIDGAGDQVVYVEPRYRHMFHARGRVDLFSYPYMDRLLLLLKPRGWVLSAELGPTFPDEWGPATFVRWVRALAVQQ